MSVLSMKTHGRFRTLLLAIDQLLDIIGFPEWGINHFLDEYVSAKDFFFQFLFYCKIIFWRRGLCQQFLSRPMVDLGFLYCLWVNYWTLSDFQKDELVTSWINMSLRRLFSSDSSFPVKNTFWRRGLCQHFLWRPMVDLGLLYCIFINSWTLLNFQKDELITSWMNMFLWRIFFFLFPFFCNNRWIII